MESRKSASDSKPSELVTGPTVTLYRYDVTVVSEEAEEGTRTYYTYNEIAFRRGEYEALLEGTLPAGCEWGPVTHRLFRQHQHRLTDDLYNQAYRMRRMSSDPDAWDAFIAEVDKWNKDISALASTYSTEVPELPTMPTE